MWLGCGDVIGVAMGVDCALWLQGWGIISFDRKSERCNEFSQENFELSTQWSITLIIEKSCKMMKTSK